MLPVLMSFSFSRSDSQALRCSSPLDRARGQKESNANSPRCATPPRPALTLRNARRPPAGGAYPGYFPKKSLTPPSPSSSLPFSLILKLYYSDIQYEKRPTCNCSTVDLGEISRAFLWETYGRKVRAVPECMQSTRVHQENAPSWLAGARAGSFQPVTLLANVGNHARAAFSL